MDYESALLAGRGAAHLLTFLILAGFCDRRARYRPAISLLAVCLAGTSFALATQIATDWAALRSHGAAAWHTLAAVGVLLAVYHTRGNVARLVPKIKRSHHA